MKHPACLPCCCKLPDRPELVDTDELTLSGGWVEDAHLIWELI